MRAFLQTSEFTLTSIVNRKRGEDTPSFPQMCCYSNLGQIGGFDLIATTPGALTLFLSS